MHRRQLLILYGVLCLGVALLVWRLATDWKRANMRYAAAPRPPTGVLVFSQPTIAPHPEPQTTDIVAKNIFSPDRNSDVASDKVAPPVPVVFGTMNLGSRYEALMSEGGAPGQPPKPGFHRAKIGDQVGGYTVVGISDEAVVVEFGGQKTTVDVYQSASSVPRAQTRAVPAAAPVVVSAAGPPPAAQPAGTPATPNAHSASNDDSDVRVTIVGNRKKFERPGPMGISTWWEDIPK